MANSDRVPPVLAVALTAVFVVVAPLLPMIISGDWGWWEAWVYVLSGVVAFVGSRALAARRNPDLLAERARTTRYRLVTGVW